MSRTAKKAISNPDGPDLVFCGGLPSGRVFGPPGEDAEWSSLSTNQETLRSPYSIQSILNHFFGSAGPLHQKDL